jgi:hypothetical protein
MIISLTCWKEAAHDAILVSWRLLSPGMLLFYSQNRGSKFPETPVIFYQPRLRHIPEDLHGQRHGKLKYHAPGYLVRCFGPIFWHVGVSMKRMGKHIAMEIRFVDINHRWIFNRRVQAYKNEKCRLVETRSMLRNQQRFPQQRISTQ